MSTWGSWSEFHAWAEKQLKDGKKCLIRLEGMQKNWSGMPDGEWEVTSVTRSYRMNIKPCQKGESGYLDKDFCSSWGGNRHYGVKVFKTQPDMIPVNPKFAGSRDAIQQTLRRKFGGSVSVDMKSSTEGTAQINGAEHRVRMNGPMIEFV